MGFHPACGHRLPHLPSFMLKAGFTQANMPPGLGQLSGVTSFQNQNIVMHGNPDPDQLPGQSNHAGSDFP